MSALSRTSDGGPDNSRDSVSCGCGCGDCIAPDSVTVSCEICVAPIAITHEFDARCEGCSRHFCYDHLQSREELKFCAPCFEADAKEMAEFERVDLGIWRINVPKRTQRTYWAIRDLHLMPGMVEKVTDRFDAKQDPDLLDKLFGDPAELGDEDIDALFETLAPGTDAAAIVHRIAESAAVGYRTLNRVPPDHIQAALEATRQAKSLDGATPSKQKLLADEAMDLQSREELKFCAPCFEADAKEMAEFERVDLGIHQIVRHEDADRKAAV